MIAIVKGPEGQTYEFSSFANIEEESKNFWEVLSAKVKEMEPIFGQWEFGTVTEMDLELLKLGSFVLPQLLGQRDRLRSGREDKKITAQWLAAEKRWHEKHPESPPLANPIHDWSDATCAMMLPTYIDK